MSLNSQAAKEDIELRKILPAKQLPTIRGDIYDRNARALAKDKPRFYLGVSYQLTRILDERYIEGAIIEYMARNPGKTRDQADLAIREKNETDYISIRKVVRAAANIKNCTPRDIEIQIRDINDRIWQLREFFAWYKDSIKSPLLLKCKENKQTIPVKKAIEEFRTLQCPDPEIRARRIMKVDLLDMRQIQPLVELTNDKQKHAAQIEFVDIAGASIILQAKREYQYGDTASQLIGWVGRAEPSEDNMFSEDAFSKYLGGEVAGKSGIELVCEPVLRGQRGTVTYRRDGSQLEERGAEPEYGRDVMLTLDIELQKSLEEYLIDPNFNKNFATPMGAVILDVNSSEILAMVSLPTFDLNTARSNYGKLIADNLKPLENKAMYKTYPPGSSIKPLILIMGLEEHIIAPNDIINCLCERAPKGWPSCWIVRQSYTCHDAQFEDGQGNIGRNAIRGSCNIYFSRLANRLEPQVIQHWLYDFGYGKKILAAPNFDFKLKGLDRTNMQLSSMRQSAGQISTKIPGTTPAGFEDIMELSKSEKRMFGIGQGGLRATVLQVANAMATICRDGNFREPKLFINEFEENDSPTKLSIKPSTLNIVRDGMHAVVYEQYGTAYVAFKDGDFKKRDVTIYGKTGSTQSPANAWFAGFAEDSSGRAIAIAIVVEEGTSGSKDAAPLGRRMIEMCNDFGYIGKNVAGKYAEPDQPEGQED